MRFHLIKTRRAKAKKILSPAVDLTSSGPPEDLVEHDVRLDKKSVCSHPILRQKTDHVVVATSHLV